MLFSSLNTFTESILITDSYFTHNLRYNLNLTAIPAVTTEFMDFSYLQNFNYFYSFFICIDESTLAQMQLTSVANLNVENMRGIYHYSIPVTKFYYPEPFIAMPSFLHYDPWFFHILIYQYWLWFVFIFVIIFFILTFLSTIRWANPRLRPRRETRGVSRSKCGDLITAMVPVSWAASIIIHESTDAVDLYDGFGTSELAIGIRSFQWGWEYYYPKDIDLNYNIQKNQSFYFGKSLKYDTSTATNASTLKYWRFYQLKATDRVVNPTQFLLTGFNKKSLFNYLNFDNLGCEILSETRAFARAQSFSKLLQYDLSSLTNSQYNSNLLPFKVNFSNTDTQSLTTERQTTLLSSKSLFNFASNMSDLRSVIRFSNNLIGNYQFNLNSSYSFLLGAPGSFDLSTFLTHNFKSKTEINSYNALQSIFLKANTHKTVTYPVSSTYSNVHDRKVITKKSLTLTGHYPILQFLNNTTNLAWLLHYGYFNEKNSPDRGLRVNDFSHVLEDKEIARTAVGVHNIKNLTLNTPAVLGNLTRSNAHLLTNKIAETNVNPLKQYYLNNHHLVVDPTTNPSVTNRFLIDSRNSPVLSTDLFFRSTLYDSTSMGASDETPLVLQGPELRVPEDFMSMGHDFKHYGTGKNFRNLIALSFNFDLYNTHWPAAPLYADYESRRWQSSELLEDVFWEEVVPGFYYYDYLFFKDHFNDYTYFHKNNVFGLRDYLFLDKKAIKKTIWKDYVVERPYLVDLAYNTAYPLAVTVDDDIVDYSTLSRQSFFSICKTNELNLVSDSAYDSLKSYNAYNNNFLMNTFVTTLGAIKVSTTLESFGMFRDDDDGLFNLVTPQKSNQTQVVPRVLVTNWHRLYERDQLLLLNRDMSLNLNLALMNSQPNFVLALKNVKMAFNSIQKVFRVKLDEMRSHARLSEYSQTGNQAMFVATARPAVKSWGGKNALDFVAAQTFKSTIQWPKNNLFMLATANNTSMFDFPFTTGVVNDATRYIWTDWSSKWKSREIVASSLAKYTMYGMNHVQRIFDFGTDVAANYRDSEQYISRLSHSRQNAINSWMFTPFGLLQSYMTSNQNLTLADCSIRTLLRVSSLCWTSVRLVEINSSLFFASQSGSYTPTRNYINLYNAIGAYQHYLTSLGDILTKREFMYRQLFEANSQWVNLPLTAIAAPSNPLFQELKTAFTYLDVTTLKSEYGRNEYLHNFNFTFRYTASGLLVGLFKFVRMNGFSMKGFSMDYFTNFAITKLVRDDTVLENYYFARRIWDVPNVPDSVLVKSQHKPMKKGIANMIKLHATGAIALPIEMRVQLLASSRDVIHSWSVPSAGVKIDCIPGYSSHRVITFLLSGIYWGQCMEICGRYHHWMPIIVYFMKRDLFLLWCIHFIFLRDNHNAMGVADRFYADFSETVSSDYTTWQQ